MQELSEHGERRLTKYGFSVLTFWTYLLRNRSSRSIQTLGAKMEEELLLLRISAVGATEDLGYRVNIGSPSRLIA